MPEGNSSRLAAKAKKIGRKALRKFASVAAPDTRFVKYGDSDGRPLLRQPLPGIARQSDDQLVV